MHRLGTLALALAATSSALADLSIQRTDKAITLLVGSRPALTYWIQPPALPEGRDPVYSRSGYIHPLRSPSGASVTGDLLAEHAHHHGIWSAWTSATFDGRKVDFWNSHKRQGAVEHREVLDTIQEPDKVGFAVRIAHVETQTGERIDALSEIWTVTLSVAGDGSYLVDLSSRQRLVSERSFSVNRYHYGGFGFRATEQWSSPEAVTFRSDRANDRIEADQQPSRWVLATGSIDGRPEAVTALCHPSTFRAPQPARIHGTIPYFSWAPGNQEAFRFEPSRDYVFNYRYIVWAEPPTTAAIEAAYDAYAAIDLP